jgi:hypothetical protein
VSSLALTFDSTRVAQSPKSTPDTVVLELAKILSCFEGEPEVRGAAMGDFERIQESRRGLLQLQDDEVCEGASCSVPCIRSDDAASVGPHTVVYPGQGAVECAQLLGGSVSNDSQLFDSLCETGELAGEHRALVQEPLQVWRRRCGHNDKAWR